MEPTRFNVFQRVLRHWDALHAYNAAQVLHLRGEPDIQLLTDRWNDTLRALGIGAVHVEGRRSGSTDQTTHRSRYISRRCRWTNS